VGNFKRPVSRNRFMANLFRQKIELRPGKINRNQGWRIDQSVVSPMADSNQVQESAKQVGVDCESRIVSITLVGNDNEVNQNRTISCERGLSQIQVAYPVVLGTHMKLEFFNVSQTPQARFAPYWQSRD
jgi:hypothetical protein